MTQPDVYVSLEFTPNPNTLKYNVNRELLSKGSANFRSLKDAEGRSPLAAKLLATPGIDGVMIGKDFVTINKAETGDWDVVHKNASSIIESHLKTDEPVLIEKAQTAASAQVENSAIELKIKDILDREIRPAVAMDGGDIQLDRYEDGTVYVFLHGSCSGCPSSTATLKMGVEKRLREEIPEILEVIAV
jgi:Fe-S cluster biogenesis protein NfuA